MAIRRGRAGGREAEPRGAAARSGRGVSPSLPSSLPHSAVPSARHVARAALPAAAHKAERAEGRVRCLCPQRGGHGGRGGGRHRARLRLRRGPRRDHQHLGTAAARTAQRPRADSRSAGNALRAARGTWAGGAKRGGPRGLGDLWGLGPGVQRVLTGPLAELHSRGEPGWPSGACSGRTAAPSPGSALRSSPEVLGLCPGAGGAPPRYGAGRHAGVPVPSCSLCRLPGLSRAAAAPRSSTGVCRAVLRLFGRCGLPCKERKLCLGL